MKSLPPGWAPSRLEEITDVVRPRAHPQDKPNLPYIGMDNVGAHSMKLLGSVPAGTMKSSAVHFQPGDVLYGRLRPYLNKVFQPDFEGLASAEFIPLTAASGVVPDFVRYRLNSADFVAFTSNLDEGDRPRVDWDGIRSFSVALPPSVEQSRIVDAVESYLSRLDSAIETLERVRGRLKAYRASALKAAVEGRLVPTEADLATKERRDYEPAEVLLARILRERRRRWEETELARLKAAGKMPKDDKWKGNYREPKGPETKVMPKLPSRWCWATLEQVSDVQLGQQRAPVHAAAKKQIPYVRAANITWSGLDLDDVKTMGFHDRERYSLKSGDVLLSEASGSPMEAGKPVVWKDEIPGACYQKTVLRVRPIDSISVLSGFLRLVFLRDCVTGKFAKAAPGVGIVHLTAERMLTWPIPLAPKEEQDRIVEEVDRLESNQTASVSAVHIQMTRVSRLRQAILKWAFEGRLVDQDLGDEPAETMLARVRADRAAVTPPKKQKACKVKSKS